MKLRRSSSIAQEPRMKTRRRKRFSTRDLMHESLEALGARPSRLFIMLIGTVLGIASLVVTVGLAQTASGQIAQQFDAVAATRVTVEPASSGGGWGGGGEERPTARIPWDAVDRVSQIAGVESSSVYARLPQSVTVAAVEVQDPAAAQVAMPQVVAVSPDFLQVAQGELLTGRFFDTMHDERQDRVVVLGERAATKLGINRVTSQPAIFLSGRAYTVIGIVDSMGVRETLLDAVMVPAQTARGELGLTALESLDISIDVGAGPVVARQAPIALNPNSPDGYRIGAPPSRSDLQSNLEADFNVLFVAIGVIALLAGGIGIANVALMSVSERKPEIGLRRALGARTRDIANQFILESLISGVLGGLIGVALGLFALLGIATVQQWTPLLSWWVAPAGVVIGAVVGLVSGLYPALKAARIEPVDALRDAR